MKIMRSKIDKMIQEEIEDHVFSTEVESPDKATSIKIAKIRVKEIIQEELTRYAKLDHNENFFSSPDGLEEQDEFIDNSEYIDDAGTDTAVQVGNKNAELFWSMFMRGLDDEAKEDLKNEIGFISSSFDGIADPDQAIMAMNKIENHEAIKHKPAMRGIFRVIKKGLNSMDEGLFDGWKRKKEEPSSPEGGARDIDAFKERVKDAIRRTYARPEEGAPADWESALAEAILKEINATYEASWDPTYIQGKKLSNLGINLMEFFVATQSVVGGFFGRDMANEIMAKLEPSMEALEADSKKRQNALKADLNAENF